MIPRNRQLKLTFDPFNLQLNTMKVFSLTLSSAHNPPSPSIYHRRRIYIEERAKVVAAVWGTEIIKFLAALAVLHKVELHQDDMKTRMNKSYSSNGPGAK